jgi:predicted Fe-Mo cluster-binding NifX family protein
MRLAVAVTNNMVAEHFGHAQKFVVFHIENTKIVEKEELINPPHQKNFLPGFLKEAKIDVLIAGGIGGMAVKGLEANQIKVYCGVSGNLDETINFYLDGKLISTNEVCVENHSHNH